MKSVFIILLTLTITAAVCPAQSPPVIDDPESYAIYEAIFGPKPPNVENDRSLLVIADTTTDYPTYGDEDKDVCLKPDPAQEATLRPLITAYHKANEKPSLLIDKFHFPFKYQIVPEATIDAFFGEKGKGSWAGFYKKFPKSGGFVYVSSVGFNADKTLALVYAGHSCGGLCGGGSYHLFKKLNNKWTEINWPGTTCTWVSMRSVLDTDRELSSSLF